MDDIIKLVEGFKEKVDAIIEKHNIINQVELAIISDSFYNFEAEPNVYIIINLMNALLEISIYENEYDFKYTVDRHKNEYYSLVEYDDDLKRIYIFNKRLEPITIYTEAYEDIEEVASEN